MLKSEEVKNANIYGHSDYNERIKAYIKEKKIAGSKSLQK